MKEGWALKSVKDVALVIAGQSPEGRYYNADKVGLPFYQGKKEFGEKNIKPSGVWTSVITKTAIAGDILMSVRAPVGPVNVSVEEICIGRGLAAIRQKDNVIHDFLYYFFKYYEGNIKGNTGAVFDSINKAQIENIPFLIPPIPEQQRIVSIIDEAFEAIDKAIENTQKNLQNAKELFESYLNSVFENGGEGWAIHKLGEVASFSQGIQVGLEHQLTEPQQGYVRFIRIVDYTQNTDDIRYVPNPGQKYFVNEDDIVMVRYGTPGLIGRGKAGVIANNLFKITIQREDLLNDFLSLCLSQKHIQTFLSTQGSATMPALNFGQLKNVMIIFPSLKDQHNIVQQLDALQSKIQTLEATYQQKFRDLEELKKSVLNKAFAGEL